MTPSRLLAGASGYSFKEWKGTFYPDPIKPEDMLGLLFGPLAHGRDQQHVLPDAQGVGAGELGGHHAGSVSLLDQGLAPDHPHGANQGRVGGRIGDVPVRHAGGARRQARTGAVPAAAEPQEGFAATLPNFFRCFPPITARRSNSATTPGSPMMSTTRSSPPARRCAFPSARTTRRRRWSRRRRGATSGSGSKTIPRTSCARGRHASSRLRGSRRTSTSCTSPPPRVMRRA